MENKSMKIIAWILLVVIVTTLISSMFFTAETYKIKSAKNQNLHEEKGLKLSDANAISEVMKGNSVKKDTDRGYGVRTSKDVVCKALKGGGFILISGSCALVSVGEGEKLASLPNFYWQGVIIAYRIPKPTASIDYLKYIV